MSTTQGNIFTRGLSRISRRKKKTKSLQNSLVSQQQPSFDAAVVPMPMPNEKSTIFSKGMDRLRRSLRLPKKRRDRSHDRHLSPDVTGGSKTEQWQPDEGAVRSGTCCFNVKYLGSVEVYESRGMTVCEGALKSLKANRKKPVKAVLYVSGDGLRVVDQGNSRGLLVDQTIEKVSFCAPDRQTDKGFAYICRDGASRRWMCHGFLATKETGERLSHAVGCAFSICLEKKKKRDEETSGATATSSTQPEVPVDVFHPNWGDSGVAVATGIEGPSSSSTPPGSTPVATASRSNLAYQSFRKHVSIEDRYLDPQSVIINEVPASNHMDEIRRISKPRPSGNPALFQRQGSLRAPDMPTSSSSSSSDQFKRNLSLRTVPTTAAAGGSVEKKYVRAVAHNVSHRARRGVASKVRALKLAHSQARLRSYSQTCESAAYIDGRCEFYPSLSVPWSSTPSNGIQEIQSLYGITPRPSVAPKQEPEPDEAVREQLKRMMLRAPGVHSTPITTPMPSPANQEDQELRRLIMFQEFRDAGVDVNTTQPGYGYGIEARIEPIIPEQIMERRSSCPTFGTQLYNEPIYEGDEDPLGLGITPTPTVTTNTTTTQPPMLNGLDGLDLNFRGVPAPVVSMNHHANGDFVSAWPGNQQQPKPILSPLEKLQKQFEDVKLIHTSSGESTPTTSARSKADEWLDDVLRVSMSMSPTSPTASSSSYSTLPKSGPPPAHAPPPLPVRQAVSNGSPSMYQQQNSARNSPAGINWNSSPNPIQMMAPQPKPVDPFDVQWSRLAVNNTN